MNNRRTRRARGFSLVEMMISMALGSIVLAAAVQMYTKSVGATWLVGQRAEMQQDFRAASNMLTKDLSLAGAGLVNGAAIALPSGSTPQYGCDQSGTCYITGAGDTYVAGTYPIQGGTPYLYGLITGYGKGQTLNTTSGRHRCGHICVHGLDLLFELLHTHRYCQGRSDLRAALGSYTLERLFAQQRDSAATCKRLGGGADGGRSCVDDSGWQDNCRRSYGRDHYRHGRERKYHLHCSLR